MGFLAKVVLNLLRSLFLFNRATQKTPIHAPKPLETEEGLASDEILRMKYQHLRDELTAATDWASLFGIPEDTDLNDKIGKEAFEIVEAYSYSRDEEAANA